MLSFINMGGRKKRPRKKGSRNFSGPSSRGPRRNSRGSGSFMTSGTVGDIVIERRPSARPVLSGEPSRPSRRNAVDGMKDAATSALVETISAPKRSPEIQLEFKHDSLLQSLPEEFLRYRKGSMTSSVDDTRPSPYMQGIERTSNFEGSPRSLRAPQEKGRRMGPLPTVTPIKIPASPLQSIPPNSQQRISRTRHSLTANSLAWASDSEVSPVSGMSAARDVLAESFSFSARGNVFGDASTKERDSGGRFARQDSATLPKENVWEGLTYSPSISRRSSTHSIKKRKHDIRATDLPPFDASALPTPRCRKDEVKAKAKHEDTEAEQPPPPPRKDSMHNHQRSRSTTRNPPPPGLTPSAQKLGQSDQAALHRISRISEADVEASSSPLVVPTSGSTSDSFSRKSKAHSRSRKGTPVLSSPLKVPSMLSTPSTYSQYTASPFASPNKSAGASSSKSDYDYESFLEDFEFVSSGPSSRGGKSGYAGSADSPGFVQVPMTARSVSSASGSNSASATGSAGFLQISPNTSSRAVQASTAKRRRERSSSSSRNPLAKAKVSGSANDQYPNNTRRNGSTSSAVAVIGKSPISSPSSHEALRSVSDSNKAVFHFPGGVAKSNGLSPNADHAADSIHSPLKVQSTNPKDSESEMRRPSLPQLHVTNRGDSPSPPSSASPPSCRSPDLLDMLIPNGHIVAPISRRQVGRKRSGSTPSPIKITPAHSLRYLPMNGDDDELEINDVRNSVPEVTMGAENAPLSGDIQTFPETPVLFSPDYAMSIMSRSNSITLAAKHPNTTPYLSSKNTIPLQSLVITPASCTTEVTKITPIEPNGGLSVNNEATSMSSACSNSPPISPLQPPPPSPASVFPAPKVQTVLNAVRQSPPLLEPVPKRRASHIRPPLPFGPRKPNSHVGNSTITAPLTFAPRRSVSESAAGNSRAIMNAKPATKRPESPLPTPTFKTTPVNWRGLTLDAAKWTFSSSQLQSIVRMAIEQSAQASSIRLLSRDVYEKLPVEIDKLEACRLDIQKDYKVLVRRRCSFIQRLTSLSSNGRVVDITAVVRDAEELAKITASCDKLVEELHNVDDQIAQMCRLQDVHQASALAVALRKLNASLFRQTSEVQKLQSEIINIHAERDEAWRKAEELEHDLDALAEQSGSSRRKSVSSSRRSSRVSLARQSSSRTSKAGLRLSGHSYQRHSQRSSVSSSLLVHHATSARTTFSSDIVPPVPPLPIMDPSYRFGTSGMPSSHPPTSIAQTSAIPSTSDGLYDDVYDLLGVKHADRSIPSPSRPHSEIYCIPPSCTRESDRKKTGYAVNVKPAFHSETMRFRSGSLPSLVPPQPEIEDADAIIAMLDFRD